MAVPTVWTLITVHRTATHKFVSLTVLGAPGVSGEPAVSRAGEANGQGPGFATTRPRLMADRTAPVLPVTMVTVALTPVQQ